MPGDYLRQVVHIDDTGHKWLMLFRALAFVIRVIWSASIYRVGKYRFLNDQHNGHVVPAMLQGVKRSKKTRNLKVQWTTESDSVSLIVTASINQSINQSMKRYTETLYSPGETGVPTTVQYKHIQSCPVASSEPRPITHRQCQQARVLNSQQMFKKCGP